ncbi:hypothetical protein F53441_4593 [Fusarium austroafricanum]|uniref:Uncharacterized protein n=1 Tax=Fusarium austroafricanum TaxID=2364996 RepID=A0A8H4KNH9_9HYPO|nr:hypothetical protein F53441_4593 [Fusarium austroafricanum]
MASSTARLHEVQAEKERKGEELNRMSEKLGELKAEKNGLATVFMSADTPEGKRALERHTQIGKEISDLGAKMNTLAVEVRKLAAEETKLALEIYV